MPYITPVAAGVLTGTLVGTLHLGPGTPKLAMGIATGVDLWLHTLPVTTVDTGTVGVGVGLMPLLVPSPLLQGALAVSFASEGILGPVAPLTIQGISLGLSACFLQALIVTNHPGVGVGAGVVRFGSNPATSMMLQGFASQQMMGEGAKKIARAIGQALDTVFGALVLPIPIAGAPAPAPAAGSGLGSIL